MRCLARIGHVAKRVKQEPLRGIPVWVITNTYCSILCLQSVLTLCFTKVKWLDDVTGKLSMFAKLCHMYVYLPYTSHTVNICHLKHHSCSTCCSLTTHTQVTQNVNQMHSQTTKTHLVSKVNSCPACQAAYGAAQADKQHWQATFLA